MLVEKVKMPNSTICQNIQQHTIICKMYHFFKIQIFKTEVLMELKFTKIESHNVILDFKGIELFVSTSLQSKHKSLGATFFPVLKYFISICYIVLIMLLVICFSFLLSISATCLGCLWPLVISFLQRHLQFLPQMKIRELLLPDLTRFLKNLVQMGHLQLLEKLKVYLLMFQQSPKLKANT